jgi:hypothetical protein
MVFAVGSTRAAISVGLLSGLALIGYLVLLAALVVTTRPRRPDPGPAVMDIPGDEPPAVAGFLVNTWRVPRAAVPATLIDLAARRVVAIEQVAPEDFIVRLRGKEPPTLTAYERRVYEHVRALADAQGVVPCRALTTGPAEQSSEWWKAFRREVVADARRQGLSRSRWRGWELVALAVAATVPAGLGFIALALASDHGATTASSGEDSSGWSYLALVGWFVLVLIPLSLRIERETRRGSEVAARWLGLQVYLRDDDAFAEYPPAAVAIWDRYLAYGAAFGVARAAVAGLPMGSESMTEAWSKESGHWRLLRISYRSWPPGWGRSPRQVVVSAILTSLPAGVGAVAASLLLARLLGSSVADHTTAELRTLGVWALVFILIVALFWLGSSIVWLCYAIPDLEDRTQVRGRVLRVRETEDDVWLAVDDGSHERVLAAWHLEAGAPVDIVEGCLVDATVSTRLGHVFALARVPEPGARLPARRQPAAGETVSHRLLGGLLDVDDAKQEAPGTFVPTTTLDLATIASATGVQLSIQSYQTRSGPGGPVELWELADGRAGKVFLRRHAHTGRSRGAGCLFAIAGLSRAGSRQRERVDGVGERATWSAQRAILTANRAGDVVTVAILLSDVPLPTRRAIATSLARQVLTDAPAAK